MEQPSAAAPPAVLQALHARIDQQVLLNSLLTLTSLESSVSINLVMIGRDGRPKQKSLLEIVHPHYLAPTPSIQSSITTTKSTS